MRLAIAIQHRGRGIVAEPAGSRLVGATGQFDGVAHVQIARRHVLRLQPDLGQHRTQFLVELLLGHLVVRRIVQGQAVVAIDRHAVVRVGQVLGRQPEIHRVARDLIQRPVGHQRRQQRFFRPIHAAQRLAVHLDVAHREGKTVHPEIEVVQRQRLLEHGVVRSQRQRQHRLAVMEHIVASHLARPVGQPGGMLVVGGTQQQRGGIRRPARHHDDVRGEALLHAGDFRQHAGDAAAGGVGFEFQRLRIAQQRDIGMFQRGAHGNHLGVGFRMHQAGETVAGLAADAAAIGHVGLVQQHGTGRRERMVAGGLQVFGQFLDARFIGHRRCRIVRAAPRLRRIDAVLAMHLVQMFGRGIVRFQFVVADRPGGRHAVMVLHFGKILLAEAVQRRTKQFGGAADKIMHLRLERFSVRQIPGLRRDIAVDSEDVRDAPVARLPRQPVAALQDQHLLARWRQPVRQCAAPCPAADDDDVVLHRYSPTLPCMIPPSAKIVVAVR